jgi:hypothetical protein
MHLNVVKHLFEYTTHDGLAEPKEELGRGYRVAAI